MQSGDRICQPLGWIYCSHLHSPTSTVPGRQVDIYTPLCEVLDQAWVLWEILVLAQPLMVVSPTPGAPRFRFATENAVPLEAIMQCCPQSHQGWCTYCQLAVWVLPAIWCSA